MKNLFLALLCAAPLAVGYTAYEAPQPAEASQPALPAETVYVASMGCDLVGCTDPTHYHTCPAGCADPTHPYCGQCWEPGLTADPDFCPSMGCTLQGCTDPTHYHYCAPDCAVESHYHTCPAGCVDPTHSHTCPAGDPDTAVYPYWGNRHHGGHRGCHGGF